jgi:hypothetical protein
MVTCESGCPVVIENWLAPQAANPSGEGTDGKFPINFAKHEGPICVLLTFGSYADNVEKVNTPLKLEVDTLESVTARSRPPNFIRCLP